MFIKMGLRHNIFNPFLQHMSRSVKHCEWVPPETYKQKQTFLFLLGPRGPLPWQCECKQRGQSWSRLQHKGMEKQNHLKNRANIEGCCQSCICLDAQRFGFTMFTPRGSTNARRRLRGFDWVHIFVTFINITLFGHHAGVRCAWFRFPG